MGTTPNICDIQNILQYWLSMCYWQDIPTRNSGRLALHSVAEPLIQSPKGDQNIRFDGYAVEGMVKTNLIRRMKHEFSGKK
jgi:hypothetical protein